ncbi:cytochrome P450 [Lentzea sp. NBRC 105346]|uniref:cytochrome P450 family protein n=1 Tax=Lentzea sp. NBRC 105346 TaxID=3032205 RepID=UPI0024A4682D|nr:cytochrome P450 [Lentzea sp. NBRC 105346]GLZ29732.1 cytochrome P450 [Lentzea sp. NBRC 105346]
MTTLTRLPAEYINDPHEVHDLLRAEGPVHEIRMVHGLKVWLVTRHEEAKIALTDPRISKNMTVGGYLFEQHAMPDSDRREFDVALTAHMLNTDPPDHARLRKLVNKAFTPRRVELLRPRVEEITEELLDAMSGEVDLLESFAFPLPITVISELLGIPVDDREAFRDWTTTLLTYGKAEKIAQASASMAQYMYSLVDAKTANPGDDFFSALVQADDSGDRLSRTELVSMAFLLLVAGHETTVNLIGNAVLALLRNPDQLELLKTRPELIAASAEEFLRYEGPINLATFRYTTEPVEIGGVTIPANELVMVSLLGANRDGERFSDPHKLDVTRNAGGHLAFGHGIHYCLGAPLARLEFEVALKGLLARFPDLELAGTPEELAWRDSSLIRGLITLPVRLKA